MIYPIEIAKEKINKEYLKKFLDKPFKEVVKFVADIELGLVAFGGELHSDGQELLIEQGSDGKNLWGGNIFLSEKGGKAIIEYSSLINIKPSQKCLSIDVRDKEILEKMERLLKNLIVDL